MKQIASASLTRNVDRLRLLLDSLKRTLDTVVNVGHETGAELDREGLAGTQDGVADRDARGLLVDLDRGAVRLDTNDLCVVSRSATINEAREIGDGGRGEIS